MTENITPPEVTVAKISSKATVVAAVIGSITTIAVGALTINFSDSKIGKIRKEVNAVEEILDVPIRKKYMELYVAGFIEKYHPTEGLTFRNIIKPKAETPLRVFSSKRQLSADDLKNGSKEGKPNWNPVKVGTKQLYLLPIDEPGNYAATWKWEWRDGNSTSDHAYEICYYANLIDLKGL